jgi:predicted regulator of Ras-like GTPase activity (Roadblock/LC7/MglB family)
MVPAARMVQEVKSDTSHKTKPPVSHQPKAPAAPPAKPATEAESLIVGLTALAEAWPEAVRKEVVQWNLVDAKVALPIEVVEQGLRQGRLAFGWKLVRGWIQGTRTPEASAQDNTVVDLPLKVVAPLFLERQRLAAQARPKVAVDAEIPNLFFGFPSPEGGSSAEAGEGGFVATRKEDTNFYIWEDGSDRARVDESETKRRPSLGTQFVARYATPNEVVSRAAALDGVAGALIALPDGLMVASHLSPELNGETLAAFLPQIFGKVTQCTKELRMGELNNLHFTVGNIPWKIFRVNAIFFAAFGRVGEPLPTGQLAALAAELDHKPK